MSLKLFEKFVAAEGLLNYLDELYNNLYNYAVEDFDREVKENVLFIVYGAEYSVSVEKFYQFDRDYAIERWAHFVGNWIEDYITRVAYKSDCTVATIEKIDALIGQFVEWLRTLDNELDAELAVRLLTGEVSEHDIALKGLAAYLHTHCAWYYPI